MKIFKKKFFIKLVALLCLFLTLLNFGMSNKVYAEEEEQEDNILGGALFTPIIHLLTSVGDIIMELLHTSIQEQEAAIIKINGSEDWWDKIARILVTVIAIIAAIAVTVAIMAASGGIALAAAALVGKASVAIFVGGAIGALGTGITAGIGAGLLTGVAVKEGMIPNDIYLPAFSISPERIFKNEIFLFDIDFFGITNKEYKVQIPHESTESFSGESISVNKTVDSKESSELLNAFIKIKNGEDTHITEGNDVQLYNLDNGEAGRAIKKELLRRLKVDNGKRNVIDFSKNSAWTVNIIITSNEDDLENKGLLTADILVKDGDLNNVFTIDYKFGHNYSGSSSLKYAEIATAQFSGGTFSVIEVQDKVIQSTAQELRNIVSTWYFILRNIALLILMLLLIYSGIRIVIGSTAGEKAKHKERLMDWFVAVCLIFIMHYIMIFAIVIVDNITNLIGQLTTDGCMGYIELTEIQKKNAEEILGTADDGLGGKGTIVYEDENGNPVGNHGVLIWPTDLTGLFRIQSEISASGTGAWAGYSLVYVILVLYTLFFAWTYLRRVLYMVFLTIIAPLVAMTYPLDKITDGKAQAFNAWMKEYIFNLMIQPLHLLLYSILISSAFELASKSAIYAIVAVGFMMPAEKLLRSFFGFEKAKTPGILGGAAGAALTMTGLQSLMRKNKSHRNNDSEKSSNKTNEDSGNIKLSNNDEKDATFMDKNASNDKTKSAQPMKDNTKNGRTNSSNLENEDSKIRTVDNGYNNISYDDNENDSALSLTFGSGIEDDATYSQTSAGYGDTYLANNQEEYLNKDNNELSDRQKARQRRQESMGNVKDNANGNAVRLKDPPKTDNNPSPATPAKNPIPVVPAFNSNAVIPVNKTKGKSLEERERDFYNNFTWKGFGKSLKNNMTKFGRNSARKIKGVNKAMGAASAAYAKGMREKVFKRVKNGQPLKSLVKGVAGVYGGALMATAGLAIGVASGDPNKAFQYGTAGLVGGYSLGKNTADSAINAMKVDNTGEMQREATTAYNKEQDLMSEENINYLTSLDKFKYKENPRKEAKQFLDTTGRMYYDYGITDVADMVAIDQIVNGGKENPKDSTGASEERQITLEQAVQGTILNQDRQKKFKDMTPEEEEGYREAYKERSVEAVKNYNPNLTNKEEINMMADETSNNMIEIMKKLEDTKDSNREQVMRNSQNTKLPNGKVEAIKTPENPKGPNNKVKVVKRSKNTNPPSSTNL